ncbi:RNA-dependent ATPase rok1 [Hanseniaspora osmophila]|uniref:ATP-dependent RNA helicase ROK1 n=1 Tax=Hanseniaspora osmophila TaxID=56408 RepID=A0A1E5RV41_9ASCO|nr:ATP-dependent RNA helicase ROK1 [Hanseniaspora osmophila]
MDIFKVLTRGANIKNTSNTSKKTTTQLQKQTDNVLTNADSQNKDLSKDLDFFHNKKIVSKVESSKREQKKEHENSFSNGKNTVESDNVQGQEDTTEVPPTILSKEDAVKLRKTYKGNVTGSDSTLPIGSFEDLISRFQFNGKLLDNLITNGFTEPTPIQCEAIPATLLNKDILACAPTGSGKTLAFLIPLLQQVIDASRTTTHNEKADKGQKNVTNGLKALIISPTKDLANQIYEECIKLSSRIVLNHNSDNVEQQRHLQVSILSKSLASKLKQSGSSNNKNRKPIDILITTPLRLIDMIKEENALDLSEVKHLIFDEADKLFDKTFLEQTDHILAHCTSSFLQKSMFSATIPSNVEEIASTVMSSDMCRIIIGHKEAANSNIEQKIIYCGNEEGKLIAIRQLVQEGEFKPPVIIFLESITRAKALYHELLYDKLNVDVIHAERTQLQRNKIIENFKNGSLWCLICTDVLARGVDFKGVNLVINYDVPNTAQSYVHRIGRTGRNGRQGKSITLYTKQDALAIKPIVNVMKQSGCAVSEWMEKMDKLTKREKQLIKSHKNKQNQDIKRKQISTVPRVIKKKKRQRVDMIEASKKRKTMD